MNHQTRRAITAFLIAFCFGTFAKGDTSREILDATGIQGGLIVHVGCGDGKLTAALRANDSFIVHGLDADAKNVEAARKHIQSLGLYGKVSAGQWDGKRLPYADNLVNLIVTSGECRVTPEEMLRVLAPNGVVLDARHPSPVTLRKPWPKEIDEWPQHFHGADNNAVARDSVVGPPRRFQWIAEPQWSRSHLGLPSVTSMVSSKGRLFDIEDQASAEHPSLPGKFALVARDAFNGARLWQRPLPDWEPVTRHIKSTPVQLQRRLAAIGETVYCTPGLSAPLTTFDAGSGKLTRKFAGTERTQEFAFDRGVLYAVVGDRMNSYGGGQEYPGFHGTAFPLAVYGKESPNLPNPKCSIVALDADSGRRLWEKSGDDTRGYQAASLAICGDHAVYCMADALVCLDRATGRQLWRAKQTLALGRESGAAPTLVLSDSAVYVADARTLNAYSLKDGSSLWAGRALLNHHKPPNLYLAAGLVWSGTLEGYDPQTGKVVKKLEQQMTGPMGHTRCYKDRITERYYINTATGGSDFLPLDAAGEFPNPWVRGTCATGTTPCNGLLYAPPPACSCCNWVMLNALNALAPEPGLKSSGEPIKIETAARLEKGPAYEEIRNPKSEIRNDDWPTYRHDPGRSGVTKTKAPADLKQSWQTRLSTRASAPVIADGKVFVADIDAHRVCALDAADGRLLWSYTTGGRVDSPPTYYKGLVLFGSHDGWVYCLRASDSTLAWRFRDLPDRLICAYGQLESAWPVCGSVLVKDDVAYFAAGRNSFLDGGIFLYGLDPQTGRVIHQRRMYGPYDAQGHPVITDAKIAGGHQIRGFKADVFSTDGQLLYLRHQAFKPDLTPLDPEEVTRPHLIPSPGFLETIPHHRTYWTIGTTIRYDNALVKGNNPYGDLLVMDGERFYEMRGYTPNRSIAFDPRMKGYTLFAGVYAKPTAGQTEKSEVKKKKAKKRAGKKKRKAAETDDPEPKPDKTTGGSTERWNCGIPLTGKAMVLADDLVFVAGTPTEFPADDLHKAYEGRMGGVLWAASASTGAKAMEHKLAAAPVWDGLAAAQGRLYLSLQDGSVVCMEGK